MCDTLDSKIEQGISPDLVLDLTYRGEITYLVQSLTAGLGLPTVAVTAAPVGELDR